MKENIWKELKFEVENCSKCRLCKTRNNSVPGEGNVNSPIVFIGEGPGEDEDKSGRPFVGRAGQLLTKIFNTVDLKREDVYITNIVKCRPPENRAPEDDEMESCYPYLETQIALINPKMIVTVGAVSTKYILKEQVKEGITKIRGQVFDWEAGIKVVPILHPSYLLRNASTAEGSPKWLTWQDMKYIKSQYDKYVEEEENY